EPVGVKLNGAAIGPRYSPVLPIAVGIGLGLAALIPVGLLIALMLHSTEAPKVTAAVPALVAPPPPLVDSPSQTMESDQLSSLEPPPMQIGVPQQEDTEAAPPPDSTPLAPPPRTAPPVVLAPLPPTRPLELAPPFKPGISYDQSTAVY